MGLDIYSSVYTIYNQSTLNLDNRHKPNKRKKTFHRTLGFLKQKLNKAKKYDLLKEIIKNLKINEDTGSFEGEISPHFKDFLTRIFNRQGEYHLSFKIPNIERERKTLFNAIRGVLVEHHHDIKVDTNNPNKLKILFHDKEVISSEKPNYKTPINIFTKVDNGFVMEVDLKKNILEIKPNNTVTKTFGDNRWKILTHLQNFIGTLISINIDSQSPFIMMETNKVSFKDTNTNNFESKQEITDNIHEALRPFNIYSYEYYLLNLDKNLAEGKIL